MFLRPEIVEQCAELVQFNPSIFEEEFRELIEALCDNYQPFRTWLFARLCSKKPKLIEPQLARFICFGNNKLVEISTKQQKQTNDTTSKYQRSRELILNQAIPSSNDDEDETTTDNDDDTKTSSNSNNKTAQKGKQFNLNRLMNAFKFCMRASNQLVINNQSRTYYELGIFFFCLLFFILLSLHSMLIFFFFLRSFDIK